MTRNAQAYNILVTKPEGMTYEQIPGYCIKTQNVSTCEDGNDGAKFLQHLSDCWLFKNSLSARYYPDFPLINEFRDRLVQFTFQRPKLT